MMKWTKINSGVKDLWFGTVFFFLIFEGIGLIFAEHKGDYTLGLLIGSITTGYLVYHMYESLDAGLNLDQEQAARYLRNKSIWRWLIRLAVTVVAVYIPHVSAAGVLVGMFGLKFSAYLQPLLHKLLLKIENKTSNR